MIRSTLHTAFNLAFKILLLIVLTNLLFSYFQGRRIVWEELLALEALGDKFVTVAVTLLGWLDQLLHKVLA